LHTGGSNYRQQIVSVFQRLPLELANRINQLLPENMQCTVTQVQMTPHVDDEIKEEQRPELPPDRSPAQDQKSESAKQVQPDEQAATVEFSKKMDVAPDPIAWFDANIQMLAHARQFYADARQQYEAERERRRELEGQLKAHAESEAALADSLTRLNQTRDSLNRLMETHDRIQKERDALVRDLQQERETRTSLENSLQALESSVKASGQEREQLSQRIDDHADKVLSDFRVALSSAISPLVKDLPDADSAQLAEFAPNLLIIIRQIIDTLADRGIEMHQAVGRPR
jgi:chromosome segregation ATPase